MNVYDIRPRAVNDPARPPKSPEEIVSTGGSMIAIGAAMAVGSIVITTAGVLIFSWGMIAAASWWGRR